MVDHTEILHSAQLLHLLSSVQKFPEVAIILCNCPRDRAGINIGLVPFYKVLGGCKVFSYGLLGENMLPSEESFLDELRLDQNREAFKVSFFFPPTPTDRECH